MKKTFFFAALMVFLSFSAYADMYDDVKPAMTALIRNFHELEAGLNKAQDAGHVVDAFNKFIGVINDLKPQLSSLDKKYPELKDSLQTDPSVELSSLTNQMKNARAECLMTVQKVNAEYGNDPEVQKTYKYFEEIIRIR